MASIAKRLSTMTGVLAAAIASSGGLCEIPLCSASDEASGHAAQGQVVDLKVEAKAATSVGFRVSVETAPNAAPGVATLVIEGAACEARDGASPDCTRSLPLDASGKAVLEWFHLPTKERCTEMCASTIHLRAPAGTELSWRVEVTATMDSRHCATEVKLTP